MLYHAYEWSHAMIAPWRQIADASMKAINNPHNPWASSLGARTASAAFEMFDKATQRYAKPQFGFEVIEAQGSPCAIREEVVLSKPFCDLLHFNRYGRNVDPDTDPKVLILAPMSGHFATLLRGTVAQMLPEHEVYITDWIDARNVPVIDGRFDLETYIEYVMEFVELLGPDVHVMGVCQPGVPALAATALMSADPKATPPKSLILMGSPIDTRISPTDPTKLAESRPLSWFENNLIATVPVPNPGFMRRVYPGFLQLSGFMSMNMDRHLNAAFRQFENLVAGDGESAESHRKFYDEYLAVMDLTAEFYLQTVDVVFQRHLMPKGEMTVNGEPVELSAITKTALMTVEGGKDDITGAGQTHAALDLCTGVPKDKTLQYTNGDVGHYGVFNGSRWRKLIQPRIAKFITDNR